MLTVNQKRTEKSVSGLSFDLVCQSVCHQTMSRTEVKPELTQKRYCEKCRFDRQLSQFPPDKDLAALICQKQKIFLLAASYT